MPHMSKITSYIPLATPAVDRNACQIDHNLLKKRVCAVAFAALACVTAAFALATLKLISPLVILLPVVLPIPVLALDRWLSGVAAKKLANEKAHSSSHPQTPVVTPVAEEIKPNNNGASAPTPVNDVNPAPATQVTQPKANFIKDKAQLENLKSINGLSLEEIDRRARPGGYAQSGFIGKDESFKEVLKKDWETVEKLGLTHLEIAAHLEKIVSMGGGITTRDYKTIIEYKTSDLQGNTISSAAPQKLEVTLICSRGFQYDLFEPKDASKKEANTLDKWSQQFIIKNPNTGVMVYLAPGLLSYIREFGFYEGGGDENPYRVAPLKVMALLTGQS